MTDEKKNSLFKKIGKTAVKTGSDTAKGVVLGAVTGAAVDAAKEGLKQVAEVSGLTDKTDESKKSLENQFKKKENEVKKKFVKEAIKRSLK